MEFNKQQMLDNISFRVKELGKKIGELETECGVSVGYISRIAKDENSKPGIDFIANVASALKISVDTLLFSRLNEMTPTETYLVSFIDKLIADTQKHKLNWELETKEYLNRVVTQYTYDVKHPLFSYETFYEHTSSDYPEQISDTRFVSKNFGCSTYINNDCYNLRLKNGTTIYLMDIVKSSYRSDDPLSHCREFWITNPNGSSRPLCDNVGDDYLAKAFDNLFDTVKLDMKHPKIQDELKYSIDAFMNDDLEDDADPDDNLPF